MSGLRTAILAVAVCVVAFAAGAGELGAIKKFAKFPVDTFNLEGQLSMDVLEQAKTPAAAEISVDGWWPDKKLLLISFGAPSDSYYVHFRSVEMNDQSAWDVRMRASGGLVCHSRRTGAAPSAIKGTKGFASPC